MGYNLVASSFRQSFRLRGTLNKWFCGVLIGGVKLPPEFPGKMAALVMFIVGSRPAIYLKAVLPYCKQGSKYVRHRLTSRHLSVTNV